MATPLARVLRGVPGDANLKLYGCAAGSAYRLINSLGTVIASGAADGSGIVTLTGSVTVTGHLQGYTSTSYATTLPNQRYPATGETSIAAGNRFDCDVGRLGIRIIADDFSYYYGTSQYGGTSSQVAEDDDYVILAYRTGGRDFFDGSTGPIYVKRFNKALDAIDQGPVQVDTSPDGHETYCIALNPVDGKVRYVGGGYLATSGFKPMYFRETVNPGDITSWTSPVTITPAGTEHFVGCYKIGPDGRNYIAGSLSVFNGHGHLVIGTAANGSTSFTWTRIETAANGWGALGADIALDESVSPARAWLVTGGYYAPGTLTPFVQNYRRLRFYDIDAVAGTARKASGAAISLPQTFDSNGDTAGQDLVAGGLRYGVWAKIAVWQGKPAILVNGDEAVDDDGAFMAVWTGSAWVNRDITGMKALDLDQAPGLDATVSYGNWGVGALTASGPALYVYSAELYDNGGTTEMRIMRRESFDGFQTFTSRVLLDGGAYPPWSNAELNTGTRPPGAGGSGFCYPKVSPVNPDVVLANADDEAYGTGFLILVDSPFDISVSLTPATETDAAQPLTYFLRTSGLTLDPDAYWQQSGTALTVHAAVGRRREVTGVVTSSTGGLCSFRGTDASDFEVSLDGIDWAASVEVPAGDTPVWLSAQPDASGPVSAEIGIPA